MQRVCEAAGRGCQGLASQHAWVGCHMRGARAGPVLVHERLQAQRLLPVPLRLHPGEAPAAAVRAGHAGRHDLRDARSGRGARLWCAGLAGRNRARSEAYLWAQTGHMPSWARAGKVHCNLLLRLLGDLNGSPLVSLRNQRFAHTSNIWCANPFARVLGPRAEKQACACRLPVLHKGMLRRILAPMHQG